MLVTKYIYVNEEVVGTGHCSNGGGIPIQLAISFRTTRENINSQIGSTQAFPVKLKFSVKILTFRLVGKYLDYRFSYILLDHAVCSINERVCYELLKSVNYYQSLFFNISPS